MDVEGTSYPELTYRVRLGSNPLNYLVEVSDDLNSWESGPNQTIEVGAAVDNEDGTESRTVRSLQTISPWERQFMRLRTTHP